MASMRRLTAIPLAAVALYATACKESTSTGSADPSTMAGAVTSLNSAFSQNAVFQSLAAITPGNTLLAAPPVLPRLVPGARGDWPSAARDLLLGLATRATGPARALFPANTLGKVFQWDTASGGHYRITDSSAAGPAGGIRFILYAVDTATLKPRLPLEPTGYVDLVDVSNVSSNGIHLLLRVGSQTAADYTVTEVKTTSSLSLAAVGYVQNVVTAGPQVTFDLSHVLTLADSSLTTHYQATSNGATLDMLTTYTGASANQSETFDWRLQKNGSVEVTGIVTADSTKVGFAFNGTPFATVRALTGGTPTFTGPNGRALTTAEMLALLAIVQGFGETYLNLTLVFVPTLPFLT